MGQFDVRPGCENFELMENFFEPFKGIFGENDKRFQVGMKANLKDFENLTFLVDEGDFPNGYSPRHHPSVGIIKKGEKAKYKGLRVGYGILRFETDKGDMAVLEAAGNVIIQTIIKAIIIKNMDYLTYTLWERRYFINRYQFERN